MNYSMINFSKPLILNHHLFSFLLITTNIRPMMQIKVEYQLEFPFISVVQMY